MKPIDCLPFFNEYDLLEIRLNALKPYVSLFVICESNKTHRGTDKPYNLFEHKDRYQGFPIHYIKLDMDRNFGPWEMEGMQRNALMQPLEFCNPEQIILVSDLDEIPDLENYDGEEGGFQQDMYYYYLNVNTKRKWNGSYAIKRKNVTTLNKTRVEHRDGELPIIGGGWHFSTVSSDKDMIYKIESFAHSELDTPKIKKQVLKRKKKLQDPYQDCADKFVVEMPTGPKWLLDNIDRYQHLMYKPM